MAAPPPIPPINFTETDQSRITPTALSGIRGSELALSGGNISGPVAGSGSSSARGGSAGIGGDSGELITMAVFGLIALAGIKLVKA